MKKSFNKTTLMVIITSLLFISRGGVNAQTCNNYILSVPPIVSTGNVGIHSGTQILEHPFSIFGQPGIPGCNDVTLHLKNLPEVPYDGILSLSTSTTWGLFTKLEPQFGFPGYGNLVLQSGTVTKDIIITNRNQTGLGSIRFATTTISNPLFDVERMSITSAGKIGIGTALDCMGGNSYVIGAMDINLNTESEPHNWQPKISFCHSADNPAFPQIRFYELTNWPYVFEQYTGKYTTYPWYIEESNITNGPYGVLTFKSREFPHNPNPPYYEEIAPLTGEETGLIDILTLVRNGHVGININNPTSMLTIKTTTTDNSASALNITNSDDANLLFVRNDGKVQIGSEYIKTTSTYSDYRLSVDGTIICKELIVSTMTDDWHNWPDFVFKKDYKLMPLAELEQRIKKDGKLPEIPSELDIQNRGVNVVEVQAKLLQKVEELTLYMIDVNNENQALKEKISSLEKNVKKFSKKR